MTLRALPDMAHLIQQLRGELDEVLANKISNPRPTDWSRSSVEGKVMNAVVDLITQEEERVQGSRGARIRQVETIRKKPKNRRKNLQRFYI